MRPYLITAKLMRPSNMKRFPTPAIGYIPSIRIDMELNITKLINIHRDNKSMLHFGICYALYLGHNFKLHICSEFFAIV
jgi:hypothetical protein